MLISADAVKEMNERFPWVSYHNDKVIGIGHGPDVGGIHAPDSPCEACLKWGHDEAYWADYLRQVKNGGD